MAKKPVRITETVLRDGHQSLVATRMRIEDMLPQLEALDKVGYNALEAWGGATFDTCLRFLGEDPWERLDTLKAHLKTPIQMLLRGQNLLGYNPYPDDVVKAFVKKAAEHGVKVFRIFDALNDIRNMTTAIDAAKEAGAHAYLVKLVEAALEDTDLPIALHLDHGADFEICKSCIDGGFTSVMIDGSHHSFKDNIELTKRVVDYAHQRGVTVEGELGQLAGIEDDVNVSAENASYTQPEQVEEFVKSTGVDSLAIAIGTSHGAFKFKPGQKPKLRFDILEDIEKRLPNFPIVLHGASSVIPKYVEIINNNGGKLSDAIGIPEDMPT